MAQLHMPDLPPGAVRTLLGELHALHARAGWPSVREMAKGQEFSHAAVHDLFTKTKTAPKLPVLMAVVEHLARKAPRIDVEETLDRFDRLWIDTYTLRVVPTATNPELVYIPADVENSASGPPTSPIRRDDNACVEPILPVPEAELDAVIVEQFRQALKVKEFSAEDTWRELAELISGPLRGRVNVPSIDKVVKYLDGAETPDRNTYDMLAFVLDIPPNRSREILRQLASRQSNQEHE